MIMTEKGIENMKYKPSIRVSNVMIVSIPDDKIRAETIRWISRVAVCRIIPLNGLKITKPPTITGTANSVCKMIRSIFIALVSKLYRR